MQPKWLVVYTKPKNEKKVAQRLEDLGHEVYLPLHKVVKQWSDRKKKAQEPLFKSYVFLRIIPERRDEVYIVPGLVRFLFWLGKPAVVREEEIEAIKDFLDEASAHPENEIEFIPGDEITLQFGPLRGLKGKILTRKKDKLYLYIESLGNACKVSVPISQVV